MCLRRHEQNGERGSIPLALLVVIIMGGLLAAIMTRTIAETGATRFDNEYSTALHAAEIGIDDAVYRLNNQLIVTTSATETGSVDGYDYTWQATRQPDRSWRVRSTSTGPNDVSRSIEVRVADQPLFNLSLATHLGINFAGGNSADSYNSVAQTRCSTTANPNCFGIIASNGNVNIGSSGSANYADRVHIHDMANPNNNGPDRCPTSIYCAPPFRRNFDDPLDIRADVPLVERMLASCTTFGAWTASAPAHPRVSTPTGTASVLQASALPQGTVSVNGADRTVLCASTLTFDMNTTVPSTLTPATGHLIVVRDSVVVNGGVRINCGSCGGSFPASPNMPKARLLQIFTLAQDRPISGNNIALAIQVRQQARIGAAIYAPDASCGNQQSNAQVEIYGSLVCAVVLNQGGWSFHYDEDLANGITTGQYFVARWSEGPAGP